MNKVIKTIASVVLLAIGVYATYSATSEPELTELQKANLEALAGVSVTVKDIDKSPLPRMPERGSGGCFNTGGNCLGEVVAVP